MRFCTLQFLAIIYRPVVHYNHHFRIWVLYMQRFQPLLKENIKYILAPKALTHKRLRHKPFGVPGDMPPPPPGNFANLVSLKWDLFLHFDIIFVE